MKNNRLKRGILINDVFVYILFATIVVVATLLNPSFCTLNNFLIICMQTGTTAVAAFGMTFVITSGQVDLSVGSICALVGMIAAMMIEAGYSVFAASAVGLLIGLVFGLVNGLLISKLGLAAFLVTLGTSSIAEGIAKTVTKQAPVTLYSTAFADFWGKAKIMGISATFLWTLLFFVIFLFIYKYTPFGNHVKAVGGNDTAAKFSGIKVERTLTLVMALSGICAALTGLLYVSRLNQGRPDTGTTLALDAITAVALGATPFTGGKGSIATTLIGAFVLVTLTNALVIIGVPTTSQTIIKGVIVIISVFLSTRNFRLGGKKAERKEEA